jgi:hypothetical protein
MKSDFDIMVMFKDDERIKVMKFSELGSAIDANEYSSSRRKTMKATVHRSTGRLGFSGEAANVMGLTEGTGLLIIRDGANWFVKVVPFQDNTKAFKINRISGYYSIAAKGLLEVCGINYSALDKTHIFDIQYYAEDEADNAKIWKFVYRLIDSQRKVRKENTQSNEL